ncbi:MAG: hypothetical protein IIW77_01890 [Bacteroidaceae bacterium]|nr:hypothetical protein [Bacteroidaceae bacterium]
MATKLRRSLYIGLGGTGMKALLHTKKMFVDTYGEVPPMIGFMGIDTDGGEYNKKLESIHGEEIKLEPNEQLQLLTPGAINFYNQNRQDFSWVPQKNVGNISMLNGLGAGGVRSNGRVAFTIKRNTIISTINSKIRTINDANIEENPKYALLSDTLPEVHLVFSICGGTGCGTFINMAYLLQDLLQQMDPNHKVTGYAVLPGAFEGLAASEHIKPNTYAALKDLDYLMHHNYGQAPVSIRHIGGVYQAIERPFSNVFFIDNKNARHNNYGNVDSIAEMLSLALVTAAGELSIAGASVGDNFNILISQGSLNIKNKTAWASGLGACEIIYRGNELADIYKMKAVQNIIQKLQSTTTDVNNIANTWIDSAEVKIRENNGQNDLTDYIADITPQYTLNINNTSDPTQEIDHNINSNKIKPETIDVQINKKLASTQSSLRELIKQYINGDGGVAIVRSLLAELKVQIGHCLEEMRSEKVTLQENGELFNTQIQNMITEVKNTTGMFSGKKKKPICDALTVKVKEYNECQRDLQRHDGAITFYTTLLTTIDKHESKITDIKDKLAKVKEELSTKISDLQNGIANEKGIFQINLAAEEARQIVVNETEILISDMLRMLDNIDGKIFGFADCETKEIEKLLMEYANTLTGAKAYLSKGVEEALRAIHKNNPDELKRIIKIASSKSQPLFTYDHRGHAPQQNMIDMIYVGVEDMKNSILKENDLFENSLPAQSGLNAERNVAFATTGMKDKIIIYNQIGVVPIYALTNIDNYKNAYMTSFIPAECRHFDDDLRSRMEHENFEILPQQTYDENDIFDLWINGFIFGLLKNENGKYYVKSKRLGKALQGYWFSLGTAYRNEAFEEFRRKEADITREFREFITAERQRRGEESMNMLKQDVKLNYRENYSQLNLDDRTLNSRPYEKVAELVERELRYIDENLDL